VYIHVRVHLYLKYFLNSTLYSCTSKYYFSHVRSVVSLHIQAISDELDGVYQTLKYLYLVPSILLCSYNSSSSSVTGSEEEYLCMNKKKTFSLIKKTIGM